MHILYTGIDSLSSNAKAFTHQKPEKWGMPRRGLEGRSAQDALALWPERSERGPRTGRRERPLTGIPHFDNLLNPKTLTKPSPPLNSVSANPSR